VDYTESSGNVFADLGLADPIEALAKAELARAISLAIAKRHLTQAEAAAVLGIDQPKVSALTRGRLDGFSIDRLLRFLLALDHDVQITIRPDAHPGGTVRVVAAS
jgi:predicted XRE-type DNA-binding protein